MFSKNNRLKLLCCNSLGKYLIQVCGWGIFSHLRPCSLKCAFSTSNNNIIWELARNSEFHPRLSESESGFVSIFPRWLVSHSSFRSTHWSNIRSGVARTSFIPRCKIFHAWCKTQKIRIILYFTIMLIKKCALSFY